jgi:hypothetical protein
VSGAGFARIEPLSLEPREVLLARVDVRLGDVLVALPVGDLHVQLVDTARELVALARLLDAACVGEHERAVAHEQVEHRDALQVIARLDNERVADPLRGRRLRVPLATYRVRTDDDRRQIRNCVGDPLGRPAPDRRQHDRDLRAVLLDGVESPTRRAHGVVSDDSDEPDFDAADL